MIEDKTMGHVFPISKDSWAAMLRGSMVGIYGTRAAARAALRLAVGGASTT